MRAAIAVLLVVVACGSDDTDTSQDVTSPVDASVTVPTPATTEPTATTATTATTGPSATTEPGATTEPTATPGTVTPSTAVGLGQPAIWPAADVVLASPEEAAADFVATVLGVPPALGEFRQGDSRSGEIEVFLTGEDGAVIPVARSLLQLRQLGPSNGWFVISAVSDHASIEAPAAGATVPAGPLAVTGAARGFEANVNVTARVAGIAAPIDEAITMAGALETAEPFAVTLDLSTLAAGEVVMLLVRGGVGLETDPGDFGAIPVVVG